MNQRRRRHLHLRHLPPPHRTYLRRMEGNGPRGEAVLDSPMSDRAARAVVAVTPEEAPRAVETLTCAFSNDPSLER
jgi:hypothetical protein